MKPMAPPADAVVMKKLALAEAEFYQSGYQPAAMTARSTLLLCHMTDAVNEARRDGHAAGFAKALEMLDSPSNELLEAVAAGILSAGTKNTVGSFEARCAIKAMVAAIRALATAPAGEKEGG